MMDVQDELLSKSMNALQVKSMADHMQIFLAWVLFASFFDIFIYYLYFNNYSNYLNNWFFILIGLIFGMIFSISYLKQNKIKNNTDKIDALFQFFCLVIGSTLGIGICIIYYFLKIENPELDHTQIIILSGLLLSITYVMALTYLVERFSYFLCIFLPSALPAICAQLLFFHEEFIFYSVITTLWFSTIFISALIANRMHNRLKILNLNNTKLIEQSQRHLDESKQLQRQLQKEFTKTEEVKNELQLHNQLLEQKVKERVNDLKQINDRLENHQANLDFAHETAGINSWIWDIEKRSFEIAKANNEIEFRQINLKHNHNLAEHIHPDDITQYKFLLIEHIKGKTDRFEAVYRIKRNNQWCWIQDIGRVIARNASNKPLRMVGIHRNIQKEKSDQEKLKLAANVFTHVAEGIFVLDSNLCYVEVNQFFEKLLGYKQEDIIGRHLFDITVNTGAYASKTYIKMTQQLIETGEFDSELHIEFTSGKKLVLWIHINAIHDEKDKVVNYVGIITDLTDRKKQERKLSYLKHYDILTDLPNRFYFQQQLHNYLTEYSNLFKHFAVLRINIDRFKSFNDSLSQKHGDELLKKVAQRLRLCCANASLTAYLNNDDFAVIYNLTCGNLSIHQQAQNILHAFKHPFDVNGQDQTITISIGVALFPEHGLQLDSINGHAEFALDEAKRLGGDTVKFYSNAKIPILNQGINLENELRKAIKERKLSVNYQPKICIQTNQLYGFEALVRWHHPTLGYIAPDIFIPLAEETNLISDIGLIVLNETCKQIHHWQILGFDNFRVSINIVAQQIHRGHLVDDIDYALKKHNISGKMLELELTESSLLDKSEQVDQLLQQLKDRQISISLDDFGTGYSSLSYLTSYPIDVLKIDKAFISKIGQEKDEAIVNAIIAMGTAIGITLVAEGVETKAQIDFLEKHGCHILQGFYFSKPLTAAESTQYLEQHKLITI